MKITKSELISTLKEVIKEETQYQRFFKKALKKFGASSPDDMSDEKKKRFFDYVDNNWKADDETSENVSEAGQKMRDDVKKVIDKVKGFSTIEDDGVLKFTNKNYASNASDKLNSAGIAASSDGKHVYLESINEAKNDDKYVVIAYHNKGGGFVMTKPISEKEAKNYIRQFPDAGSDITKQKAVKVSDARKIRSLMGSEVLDESINEGKAEDFEKFIEKSTTKNPERDKIRDAVVWFSGSVYGSGFPDIRQKTKVTLKHVNKVVDMIKKELKRDEEYGQMMMNDFLKKTGISSAKRLMDEDAYDRDRDAKAMGYRNAKEADKDNWGRGGKKKKKKSFYQRFGKPKDESKINEDDTEYQEFFRKALEKFGVEEPDELDREKKKEFFNYVDKHWQAKDERNDSINEIEYNNALAEFRRDLEKHVDVKKMAKYYDRTVSEVLKALETRIKVLRYNDKSIKEVSINFADRPSGVVVKHKNTYSKNEGINEGTFYVFYNKKKHEVEADSLWKAKDKFIKQNKVPKSKQGLVAVKSKDSMKQGDYRFESKKKVNEEDGRLNKKIKSLLDKNITGKFEKDAKLQQWTVKEILKYALVDANFHSEAKKVDKYFRRAEPSGISDPEQFSDAALEPIGQEISKMTKWDGVDIINGIAFYMNMKLGGGLGNDLVKGLLGETNEEVNEASNDIDLMFGDLGGGISVVNRNEDDPSTRDYKKLAHIYYDGRIKYYEKDLPKDVIKKIEKQAKLTKNRK